jgi:hypothetical protein
MVTIGEVVEEVDNHIRVREGGNELGRTVYITNQEVQLKLLTQS